MNISGNTILITGGGSGIGQALAIALQAEGNTVIVTGRREGPLRETVAAHPGMDYAVLDVSDAAAIRAFAAKITTEHTALNVVINNAGIMQVEDLLAEPFDLDVAEATITTNLLGPIRLTAALLPHLRAQPSATVMTVSSGLAFVPLAATPTYSATKAAIHSYSQSLRHQLRETNVDVIEISPPGVATDLMPGHAENPQSMPLDAYIAETVALLKAHPTGPENGVERVQFLRRAEANGNYDEVFAMLNG
ncbi:SDR family oxidoreductase [Sphingomonas sp. PB4P5]|uniref:SDR family oxidoreductase n=1 Tax=Parasphingomonas puruogangriensis TaxID=3096155 RepID=UPI002FC90BA7